MSAESVSTSRPVSFLSYLFGSSSSSSSSSSSKTGTLGTRPVTTIPTTTLTAPTQTDASTDSKEVKHETALPLGTKKIRVIVTISNFLIDKQVHFQINSNEKLICTHWLRASEETLCHALLTSNSDCHVRVEILKTDKDRHPIAVKEIFNVSHFKFYHICFEGNNQISITAGDALFEKRAGLNGNK